MVTLHHANSGLCSVVWSGVAVILRGARIEQRRDGRQSPRTRGSVGWSALTCFRGHSGRVRPRLTLQDGESPTVTRAGSIEAARQALFPRYERYVIPRGRNAGEALQNQSLLRVAFVLSRKGGTAASQSHDDSRRFSEARLVPRPCAILLRWHPITGFVASPASVPQRSFSSSSAVRAS